MQYIAGPGQKVYTKQSTHLPTLNALLSDSSLYDAQHELFLNLLPTAKSRPPLAVGAAYWDALTSAQGSVELNTKTPAAALKEVEDAVQPSSPQPAARLLAPRRGDRPPPVPATPPPPRRSEA